MDISQLNFWQIGWEIFKMWKLWLPLFGMGILLIIFAVLFRRFEDWSDNFLNKKQRERKYKDLKTLEDLRNLTGEKFEEFTAHLFEKLGYKLTLTGGSHDGGIDLVATKDGKDHFIQCKKYTNKQVSVGAVRDFYGAISDRMNAEGHFITTQFFTTEAKQFAKGKPIELIDQFRLLNLIKVTNKEDVASDICPLCSGLLVSKKGKYGEFLGCSNFPKCTYTTSLV